MQATVPQPNDELIVTLFVATLVLIYFIVLYDRLILCFSGDLKKVGDCSKTGSHAIIGFS